MPYLDVNGTRIHYTDSDPDSDKPVIVFSHGLLFSTQMFDGQVERLRDRYRCIAYDHRGQGKSGVPDSGYDMDTLTEDAAALIRALDLAPVHFAGLSMGGFVALRLAIRYPELLRSIAVLDSSAEPEPQENVPKYKKLNLMLKLFGPGMVMGAVMPILFCQTFLNDPARAAEKALWRKRLKPLSRKGWNRAVVGVIERKGVVDELDKIHTPTLVLVGEQDTATVPAKSERMQKAIAGAQLVYIPDAGHSSAIEQPEAVTDALAAFFERVDA